MTTRGKIGWRHTDPKVEAAKIIGFDALHHDAGTPIIGSRQGIGGLSGDLPKASVRENKNNYDRNDKTKNILHERHLFSLLQANFPS